MRTRWLVLGALAAALSLSLTAALPAQTGARQTIRIVATSYRFEPALIQVRQGETVILELVNADTEERNHSINAELLARISTVVRGEVAAQGVAGGRRFFAVAPGKTIEIEFVASERGTFSFICGISDHAARGQVGAINVLPSGQ